MMSIKPALVLVDDDCENLRRLAEGVREQLRDATVRTWRPSKDEDPAEAFAAVAGDDTTLVVADYDLTPAVKGLFGPSVVAWCQRRFIPVGDFSRHPGVLATEPDLFDLRVPRELAKAADFITRVFDGFCRVREGIEASPSLLSEGHSPAQILSALLGRTDLEPQLAPYVSRPALFNSALVDTLVTESAQDDVAAAAEKTRLLTYILGHVLVNAVLKYPGPILGKGPLCAYLSTSAGDFEELAHLFEGALYSGPFNGGQSFFWRDGVDAIIDQHAADQGVQESPTRSFGDYHREVLSAVLERPPAAHDCTRCGGLKGGYWCPFKKRAVCERADCSSTSSSWVPSGAYACRVERDFFDEWSPILGL